MNMTKASETLLVCRSIFLSLYTHTHARTHSLTHECDGTGSVIADVSDPFLLRYDGLLVSLCLCLSLFTHTRSTHALSHTRM